MAYSTRDVDGEAADYYYERDRERRWEREMERAAKAASVPADFRGNKPLGERVIEPLYTAEVAAILHQGKRLDPWLMADVTEVYGARTAAMIEEFDDVCADCGLHFYNPEGEDYCEICGARHNGFALTPQAMEQIGAWSPREE